MDYMRVPPEPFMDDMRVLPEPFMVNMRVPPEPFMVNMRVPPEPFTDDLLPQPGNLQGRGASSVFLPVTPDPAYLEVHRQP